MRTVKDFILAARMKVSVATEVFTRPDPTIAVDLTGADIHELWVLARCLEREAAALSDLIAERVDAAQTSV